MDYPSSRTILCSSFGYRGTKRLVSVNICSVEGNSASIFVSKVPPGILVLNKGKWMRIIFRRNKTAVLGTRKAQLPLSEGKHQLPNSCGKILFPTIFYHLNFQYRIRTDQIRLAHTNIPLKGHKTIWESRKLHSKPLSYYFSLGAPVVMGLVVRLV